MIYVIIVTIIIVIALISQQPTHTYKAKFGNAWEYVSRYNYGFAITGSRALTKSLSHTNCALFGPTGSGKTTSVILGSAFSLSKGKSSICFNDVSGEIYEKTSTYLASKGYRILRLDFSNAKMSESFNPLLECKTISDIQKVALLIVRNAIGESKSDVFWEQSSVMLLSLFMRYLIFHCEPEFRTLQNVLRLVEKFAVDGKLVDKMFVRANDEELLAAYKSTIVVGDKTLQSIIATARTALNLFTDNEVCRTTATNSIDFSLLRKEPVALYVCNPLKDLLYFKPLSALFFQSLFNYVLSRIPDKNERSIFFIMDEAATMRFPALSVTISNIRKFSSGILLCMQDEDALISQYGQAEAHQIKTNCGCQIYLKGQPLHTCKELSQVLGKYTYTDEKGIERARELLTADELRMCEDAIILIGNQAPIKCKPVPIYQNIWLSRFIRLPQYELSEKTVIDPLLIPFI